MPLPKRRHSRSRSGMRRAHDGLTVPHFSICKRCSQKILPHRVCHNCGYYAGKPYLDVEGI